MWKGKTVMAQETPHQSYDSLLKRLVENQSRAIIPLLFPDLVSEVLEELNVEVLREIVQTRFPTPDELAETTVARTEQPDALNVLVVQISAVSDEQAARRLLERFAAS